MAKPSFLLAVWFTAGFIDVSKATHMNTTSNDVTVSSIGRTTQPVEVKATRMNTTSNDVTVSSIERTTQPLEVKATHMNTTSNDVTVSSIERTTQPLEVKDILLVYTTTALGCVLAIGLFIAVVLCVSQRGSRGRQTSSKRTAVGLYPKIDLCNNDIDELCLSTLVNLTNNHSDAEDAQAQAPKRYAHYSEVYEVCKLQRQSKNLPCPELSSVMATPSEGDVDNYDKLQRHGGQRLAPASMGAGCYDRVVRQGSERPYQVLNRGPRRVVIIGNLYNHIEPCGQN